MTDDMTITRSQYANEQVFSSLYYGIILVSFIVLIHNDM